MASNLHLILENFYWRIRTTVPTYEGNMVQRFVEWDTEDGQNPSNSSGWARRYWVDWLGSNPDDGATSEPLREANYTFRVHIIYPDTGQHRRTTKAAMQDRNVVHKTLRGQLGANGLRGYDEDNTTTALGLMLRKRTGDELAPYQGSTKIQMLTMEYLCSIAEDES